MHASVKNSAQQVPLYEFGIGHSTQGLTHAICYSKLGICCAITNNRKKEESMSRNDKARILPPHSKYNTGTCMSGMNESFIDKM